MFMAYSTIRLHLAQTEKVQPRYILHSTKGKKDKMKDNFTFICLKQKKKTRWGQLLTIIPRISIDVCSLALNISKLHVSFSTILSNLQLGFKLCWVCVLLAMSNDKRQTYLWHIKYYDARHSSAFEDLFSFGRLFLN